MTVPDEARPELRFYRREACELCDEARESLQSVLEERAAAGLRTPVVAVTDIASDPGLEWRYGSLIPVLALQGQELRLAVSPAAIRRFLSRTLDGALA